MDTHDRPRPVTSQFRGAILLLGIIVVAVFAARFILVEDGRSRRLTYPHLLITMERTTCFGTCPGYKLTIYGDGMVFYEGLAFVKVEGVRMRLLADDQIKHLVAGFENAGFYLLPDRYPNCAGLDLPSTVVSITMDEKSKTFCHDPTDAVPSAIFDLESSIDEIVNVKGWVGSGRWDWIDGWMELHPLLP